MLFIVKVLPKAQLPEGVLLGSLKELSEQYPALVKQYYGKLADTSKDGVTAFNTTFAQDGFMLYVPKGVVVDKPIQLVNIFVLMLFYGEPPCADYSGGGCTSPLVGV